MPEINFGHTNQPKINVPLTTVKFKNDGILFRLGTLLIMENLKCLIKASLKDIPIYSLLP